MIHFAILFHNRFCIRGLLNDLSKYVDFDHEVWVLDNGSEPKYSVFLEELNVEYCFKLIRSDKNVYDYSGRNFLYSLLDCDYIISLDDDVRLVEGWYGSMFEYMKPELAGLQFTAYDENECVVNCGGWPASGKDGRMMFFGEDGDGGTRFFNPIKQRKKSYVETLGNYRCCTLTCCGCLISHKIFDLLGGFDDRMNLYGSDHDFGMRAFLADFNMFNLCDSFIWHLKDRTLQEYCSARFDEGVVEVSKKIFFEKWKEVSWVKL